jgi:hypothetical protein
MNLLVPIQNLGTREWRWRVALGEEDLPYAEASSLDLMQSSVTTYTDSSQLCPRTRSEQAVERDDDRC